MLPFFHVVFEEKSPPFLRELRATLDQNRSVLRHPACEGVVYVVCDSPSGAAERKAQFAIEPGRPFDTNGMISIDGNALTVHTPGIPEIHDQIVALVLPLLKQHECKIVDEYGRDLTDIYTGQFYELFKIR